MPVAGTARGSSPLAGRCTDGKSYRGLAADRDQSARRFPLRSVRPMAERGQIAGAVLDGPLAFDNAISCEPVRPSTSPRRLLAMQTSCLTSRRDTWLAKELTFPANADATGIVFGARVPIILTSRAGGSAWASIYRVLRATSDITPSATAAVIFMTRRRGRRRPGSSNERWDGFRIIEPPSVSLN